MTWTQRDPKTGALRDSRNEDQMKALLRNVRVKRAPGTDRYVYERDTNRVFVRNLTAGRYETSYMWEDD